MNSCLLKVNVDYSRHEIAWAEILHREIFEDGTYFEKVDINLKKSRKLKPSDSRESSEEEDEGRDSMGISELPIIQLFLPL